MMFINELSFFKNVVVITSFTNRKVPLDYWRKNRTIGVTASLARTKKLQS